MTNNLYQKYIELLNRASSTSNENDRKMLIDQANRICREPAFLESNNNNYQNISHSISSGPGNCISSQGHAFGNIGYGVSHGGSASWS